MLTFNSRQFGCQDAAYDLATFHVPFVLGKLLAITHEYMLLFILICHWQYNGHNNNWIHAQRLCFSADGFAAMHQLIFCPVNQKVTLLSAGVRKPCAYGTCTLTASPWGLVCESTCQAVQWMHNGVVGRLRCEWHLGVDLVCPWSPFPAMCIACLFLYSASCPLRCVYVFLCVLCL